MSGATLAPRWVTPKQAEQLIPYSEQTIRRAIKSDGSDWPVLPAVRDKNGKVLIRVSDIDAWVLEMGSA